MLLGLGGEFYCGLPLSKRCADYGGVELGGALLKCRLKGIDNNRKAATPQGAWQRRARQLCRQDNRAVQGEWVDHSRL